MSEKLAAETPAASKGEGNAVKKREDTHKMAEAKKRSRTTAGRRQFVDD